MPVAGQTPAKTAGTSAVVTGAARGIGRAIATALVARGHRVVITDVSPAIAETAQAIGAVEGLVQDVRTPESHREVAAVASHYGPLAVWVNNAGVGHDGTLTELTEDEVRRLVEVNALGTMWGCRAALAAFSKSGGDIVNIASLSGHGPVPGLSVYAATKAAVVSLTLSLSAEAPRRVRVHAVCPDGVSTTMVEEMHHDGRAKELVASGGRMLAPEEVAAAVVALIGRRRVVRTLPGWRGGVLRFAALAPRATTRVEPLLRAQGRRALRRG